MGGGDRAITPLVHRRGGRLARGGAADLHTCVHDRDYVQCGRHKAASHTLTNGYNTTLQTDQKTRDFE